MKYQRLDKDNALVLFIDHQTGLISLVHDYSPSEFRNNVLALADITQYFRLPAIITTSFEQGPNGPAVPEISEMLPEAQYIARPGQINAWDNDEFVKAIKATGKKQLIMAGIVTDVCVAFPALSALEAGYEVFVCCDASGTKSKASRDAALLRMSHAGAQLETWFSIASELQRDWRNDIVGFGELLIRHEPNYKALMASYKAQKK
jgi:nicotinamidase-related amidase